MLEEKALYHNLVFRSKSHWKQIKKFGRELERLGIKDVIIIFRPYFIWKRKLSKSNGFSLQNLPRINLYPS